MTLRPKLEPLFSSSPSSWNRRPFARPDHGAARSVRRGRQTQPANRQEARRSARPHPDQSFLRGLDQDPELVRACRQAAGRRRDEHGGGHVFRAEGRDPDRHGGDAQRHAPRHPRGAPSCGGRGRAAVAEGRLLGDQCRRREPRASHPSSARRAHHPPPQGPHRGPDRRHLRRHSPLPRRALQHLAAQRARRPRPRRRAVDPARRRHRAAWRRGLYLDVGRPGRCRHRHDAQASARAHDLEPGPEHRANISTSSASTTTSSPAPSRTLSSCIQAR